MREKEEKTEYSAIEQKEIDRILNYISQETGIIPKDDAPKGKVSEVEEMSLGSDFDIMDDESFPPDTDQDESLETLSADLDVEESFEPDTTILDHEETFDPDTAFIDEISVDSEKTEKLATESLETKLKIDEEETSQPPGDISENISDFDTAEDFSLDELTKIPEELESDEEIQDITDLVHNIEELEKIEQIDQDMPADIPFEDILPSGKTKEIIPDSLSADEVDAKSLPDEPEDEFDSGLLEDTIEEQDEPAARSPLEESEDATVDKIEDISNIDEPETDFFETDEHISDPVEDADLLDELDTELPVEDMPDEFMAVDEAIEEIAPTQDTDEKAAEIETDIEDADISPLEELEEAVELDVEEDLESTADEIPDIDIDSLDETFGSSEETTPEDKIPSLEEISDNIPEAELSDDLEEIDASSIEGPVAMSPDAGEIEHIEHPDKTSSATDSDKEEIDLTDKELKKLKKVIQFFHPKLTAIIKETILNDLLSGPDIRHLVDMLLDGNKEEEIKAYLEKKLQKTIDISAESDAKKRKIVTARPEYTTEGRERQARLLKITRLFGIAAMIAFIITIFSYQYIYKPIMAKSKINEGVTIIKAPGVPLIKKQKDYNKAEDIFQYVDENYVKNYLYGYHSYAKAFFDNKEYDFSLDKLKKAYAIDTSNIDTLNNLGAFFSKIPESKFKQLRPELNKYFYSKVKPIGPVDKQIDVAIDFYKKSLAHNPENITAMYGIGNAYVNLGQYKKAREYFENILSVDDDSIVGLSGLLNLFIDRDAMPDVITIHSDLEYKKILPEMPSPLLAKLASYYLSKKRTHDANIRIDYGIQSPGFKDLSDNPYPAIKNVLNALTERDVDYPPLFTQFAKLSRAQNNLTLMKKNLQTALEKEPDYFTASHLMGEYYYLTNEPVEAYRYFKKAIQNYSSHPDFTNEDFYFETENIGKTYTLMGNIFYYYFKKIQNRFGDELEDEKFSDESDEFANYEIAREKYENALNANYKSSELYFNLGRIYYMKGQYEKATTTWLNLYEDFATQPEIMLAMGNAFYHQHNLETSKGEYLKVISVFEGKEDKLNQVVLERSEHIKIFETLSSAYNNLGAVYQIQNVETKSNLSYWKSIDYAKRIERENEFARVNLSRAFKVGRENILPVIDENIPFSIDTYRNESK